MLDFEKLVIATKHGKEAVIKPLFSVFKGIECIVPENIDTDYFGTFSGERARPAGPLEVLRMKCRMGLELTGHDWVVASEGSFGPHPDFPFVAVNEEWAMLYQASTQMEIYTRKTFTETNVSSATIRNFEELEKFASKIGFPEHALILRPGKDIFSPIYKGIQSFPFLRKAFDWLIKDFECLYVETDMRAHLNPTRMKHIGIIFRELLDIFRNHCPQCQYPGFSAQRMEPGLPCEWCGTPGRQTLKKIYHCVKCNHVAEHINPDGKTSADPMYCAHCNP